MSKAKSKVGYKTPPEDHQFKKGQSGNPAGRPKGSKNFTTLFMKRLRKRVTVRKGDAQKSIPYEEALIDKLFKDAYEGDARARALIFQMARRHDDLLPPVEAPTVSESPTYGEDVYEFVSVDLIRCYLIFAETLKVIQANLPELQRLRAEEVSEQQRAFEEEIASEKA